MTDPNEKKTEACVDASDPSCVETKDTGMMTDTMKDEGSCCKEPATDCCDEDKEDNTADAA